VKKNNLSTHAVGTIAGLRSALGAAGQRAKCLLIVGDGSFCNRTLFTPALDQQRSSRAPAAIRDCAGKPAAANGCSTIR
jgi:hypothetical protein